MTRSPIAFTLFRQERHPLALLAACAVLFRVVTVTVGLALSPESLAAGIGQLCQPSQLADSGPTRPLHDPATCDCGPVCGHGCGLTGSALATTTAPRSKSSTATRMAVSDAQLHHAGAKAWRSIRAPPRALV